MQHSSLRSESTKRLWALMQRIERARHRAELAQSKSACGSPAFRAEMAEIALEWRELAREFELEDAASQAGLAQPDEPGAQPDIPPAAPARRGRHFILGAVVGALGVMTIFLPRWVEASTGLDLDHHSGGLEWFITAAVTLLVIAAVLPKRKHDGRWLEPRDN